MKKIFLTMVVVSMILLTGCSQAAVVTDTNDQKDEGPNTSFIGKWQRTANYANGELVNTASSITTFKDNGTYMSVGTCSVTGTFGYDHEKNTLITTIGSSNCPGPIGAGYVSSWQYQITEDGSKMTMNTAAEGVTVTETFIRIE